MRCEFGYCIVCDKEIAKACPTCGTRTKTSDYTEVALKWSNGSQMMTAVCLDCSRGPVWKADKKAMTVAIWNAWDKMNQKYDTGNVIVD